MGNDVTAQHVCREVETRTTKLFLKKRMDLQGAGGIGDEGWETGGGGGADDHCGLGRRRRI